MKKTAGIPWGTLVLLLGLLLSSCESLMVSPQRSQTALSTFKSKWKTDNPGASSNRQITLPLVREGNYNFTVDWGDGSSNTITSWNAREATHTYTEAGTYTVTITGKVFEGWSFKSYADAAKLIDISQWGGMVLGAVDRHFKGAINLVGFSASGTPNLRKTSSLESAFEGAEKFNGDLSKWDVSAVTNMNSMFENAIAFNNPIGGQNGWDVSAVTNMNSMFLNAKSFDQDIGDWNVSSVTNMDHMFFGAKAFNKPIGGQNGWDVSAVTNMNSMFRDATSFDQDIGNWDVSAVGNMGYMFYSAKAFNKPIGGQDGWDVSAVEEMPNMFRNATSFDQDIGDWNVSAVTDMSWMFYDAKNFDQDIGDWTVSAVKDMSHMFHNASSFNQNIGAWTVSAVTNMSYMFKGAKNFNQDIGAWVVSAVTNMSYMFNGAADFEQDISRWGDRLPSGVIKTDAFTGSGIDGFLGKQPPFP